MAQLDKSKSISGTIGNVVFRKVGKKQILQSRPGTIKQTRATRISGSEFRQCSSWSKWLRLGLNPFLDRHTDHYMCSRFTGQLYTALQANAALPKGERTPMNSDMASLGGFEFNADSPFSDYFSPIITASVNSYNEVTVAVPSFNPKTAMQFAPNTMHAELLIYVVSTNFESQMGFEDSFVIVPINKGTGIHPETVWTSTAVPQGNLMLVCAKLLFYETGRFAEKIYGNSKQCSPAQLLMAGR